VEHQQASSVGTQFRDLCRERLTLPVIVAPMFLISGPEMMIAACRAGVIGCFPAANARTIEDLGDWCRRIATATAGTAPWSINLIVHQTYARFAEELALVEEYRPPLVITALGKPSRVCDPVHAYGGTVFADVATPTQAKKALESGADGLVLLSAGAGGHTGRYNPFALVAEVRRFWDGPLVLSGGIANGRSIRAAQALGADLVYMGTRFIASVESLGSPERKRMTAGCGLEDIIQSAAITGMPANWMRPSLEAAGIDLDKLDGKNKIDLSRSTEEFKAWKNIWGAGHGVGAVEDVETVAEIVAKLTRDYEAAGGRR
jgi:nitronate monooxygenase